MSDYSAGCYTNKCSTKACGYSNKFSKSDPLGADLNLLSTSPSRLTAAQCKKQKELRKLYGSAIDSIYKGNDSYSSNDELSAQEYTINSSNIDVSDVEDDSTHEYGNVNNKNSCKKAGKCCGNDPMAADLDLLAKSPGQLTNAERKKQKELRKLYGNTVNTIYRGSENESNSDDGDESLLEYTINSYGDESEGNHDDYKSEHDSDEDANKNTDEDANQDSDADTNQYSDENNDINNVVNNDSEEDESDSDENVNDDSDNVVNNDSEEDENDSDEKVNDDSDNVVNNDSEEDESDDDTAETNDDTSDSDNDSDIEEVNSDSNDDECEPWNSATDTADEDSVCR